MIAIVDDDPAVGRAILRVVQSAGYEAVTFASGREFFEWLAIGRPACLVLDVQMSGMSGFDVEARLRVPILFITAHDDAPMRERIARSGASAHLQKPFDAETVLDAIRRTLRVRSTWDQGPMGRRGEVDET